MGHSFPRRVVSHVGWRDHPEVFRKVTHTNQYFNFESNHPLKHKRGVMQIMLHRAETVVSDSNNKSIEKWTSDGLHDQETNKSNTLAETTEWDVAGTNKAKKKYPVVIAYVKGLSEQISRVKEYRIQVNFRPTNTLRQILVKPKDIMVVEERVVCPVYQIKCSDCKGSYIVEMGRSLKARFIEHRRPSSITTYPYWPTWPTWPPYRHWQC